MITLNGNYITSDMSRIRASRRAESTHSRKQRSKHSDRQIRRCNICRRVFAPQFRFQLFCQKCRQQDDSFAFSEWLPRIPDQYSVAVTR